MFHVPLWICDLKLTALSWKYSKIFALLRYSTSAIDLFSCKPACFLLELHFVVSMYPPAVYEVLNLGQITNSKLCCSCLERCVLLLRLGTGVKGGMVHHQGDCLGMFYSTIALWLYPAIQQLEWFKLFQPASFCGILCSLCLVTDPPEQPEEEKCKKQCLC